MKPQKTNTPQQEREPAPSDDPKNKIEWSKYIQTWLPLLLVVIASIMQFRYIKQQFENDKQKAELQFRYDSQKEITDLFGELSYYIIKLKSYVYTSYPLILERIRFDYFYTSDLKNPIYKFKYEYDSQMLADNDNRIVECKASLEKVIQKMRLISGIGVPDTLFNQIINYEFRPLREFMENPNHLDKPGEIAKLYTMFYYDFDTNYSRATGLLLYQYSESLKAAGFLSKEYVAPIIK